MTVSIRFTYSGAERLVDNISVIKPGVICGYEVLKAGSASGQVKRYRVEDMEKIDFVDPATIDRADRVSRDDNPGPERLDPRAPARTERRSSGGLAEDATAQRPVPPLSRLSKEGEHGEA